MSVPRLLLTTALCAGFLAACSSVGVGIGIPIPGVGAVSVGVDSGGRVGGSVPVGTGGVSVGVGGTAQLPPRTRDGAAAPAPEGASSAAQPTMPAPR
jgi:hypothetical protein